MADFGTQGGIGGLNTLGNKMESSSKIFKTAVGEWSFGVGVLKAALDQASPKEWLEGAASFTGVLKKLPEIFTKSKYLDILTEFSQDIYRASKVFQKEYGKFGRSNNKLMTNLMDATKETQKYGIGLSENLETLTALVRQIGSVDNIGKDWIIQTSEMAELFDVSSESMSKISSMFIFQNRSAAEFSSFMKDSEKAALSMGIPVNEVAQNIAGSAQAMFRLNTASDKAKSKFISLALFSTQIGQNLDSMITSLDKFRTFEAAAGGAMQMGLAGMNVNPLQLMAMARSSDPEAMISSILSHIERNAGAGGNMQGTIAVDLAEKLGPMIGMDREDIQTAIYKRMILQKKAIDPNAKESMDRLLTQQDFMRAIDSTLKSILTVLQPVMAGFTKFLNSWQDNRPIFEGIFRTLALLTTAFFAFSLYFKIWSKVRNIGALWKGTGKENFRWGGYSDFDTAGKNGKVGYRRRFLRMSNSDIGSPNLWNSDENPRGDGTNHSARRGQQTRGMGARPGDTLGGGGNISQSLARERASMARERSMVARTNLVTAQSQKIAAKSKFMLAASGAIVAFAGAMWILAQAFKGFNDVKPEGFKTAMWAMSMMVTSIATLSLVARAATAGMGPLLAFLGVASLVGLAILGFAKGWQKIQESKDSSKIKMMESVAKLKDINGQSISNSIKLIGNSLSSFSNIGSTKNATNLLKTLTNLGQTSTGLSSVAVSLERIAVALSTIGTLTPNIKIDTAGLANLKTAVSAINTTASKVQSTPLEVTVNLIADGKKLAETTVPFIVPTLRRQGAA